MAMKEWKVCLILFSFTGNVQDNHLPLEVFYRRVATHLNKFEIGTGEVIIHPPVRIRDTDTFQAVVMVFTDKDVPPMWLARGPLSPS